MNENKEIDFATNFAAAIILCDSIAKKYKIQLENIVINRDDFYIQFFVKESISSNELEKIEEIFYKNIASQQKILLSTTKNELTKYEEYFVKENPNKDGVFYSYDDKLFFNFGNIIKTPYDPSNIKFFKILSIGGAKWLNDDNNENLVRINAVAFTNMQEADEYLALYKEKQERDHRKIGEELKIFRLDPLAGQGLPLWLPRGFQLRKTLSEFINGIEFKYDFQPVSTPILGSVDLYKTSGHYFHYKENMFPEIHLPDGEDLILRPMTCPHHVLIYKSNLNSYKDLPIRLSEDSVLHRYEASGGLTGLERVRMMNLADIHIFARMDQIKKEIKRTYEMLKEIHGILGIEFSSVDLSLHDPKDKNKFFDNPEMWKVSENQLREALIELGIKFNEEVGEAAFYGPKIDFQAKTALGHTVTVSTIQLDFLLPDRFKLTYKNKDNVDEVPVMIHVSAIGTYERFVAVLLEQTKGKLPVWLSPTQVMIIPISQTHVEFAKKLNKELRTDMIRSEIDDSEERLSKKIRNAQLQKIPYQIIIGDEEVASSENANNFTDSTISVREYGEEKTNKMTINDFIVKINNEIKKHK